LARTSRRCSAVGKLRPGYRRCPLGCLFAVVAATDRCWFRRPL